MRGERKRGCTVTVRVRVRVMEEMFLVRSSRL